MILVNQSVAHPWECDVMGHLTTRFYLARFDDASYHFLARAFGQAPANQGWVDVRHEIDYLDEVLAGDLLEVHGALSRMGGSSVTIRYEMSKVPKGAPVAVLTGTSVYFDLEKRCSTPLTAVMRESAQPLLLPPADEAS